MHFFCREKGGSSKYENNVLTKILKVLNFIQKKFN